jgi:hypothetical protein
VWRPSQGEQSRPVGGQLRVDLISSAQNPPSRSSVPRALAHSTMLRMSEPLEALVTGGCQSKGGRGRQLADLSSVTAVWMSSATAVGLDT